MRNYTGDVPAELWTVLVTAWKRPLALQSDFTRQHALEVSLAASMGLLTTIRPDGSGFTPYWHITASGITALSYKDLLK